MKTDEQTYGRPLSIEDFSNRVLVHPLSEHVVKLALRLKISANAVSVAGLLFGLLAGWFYFKQGNAIFAVTGFAAMFAWHVLDGADGKIARATQTTSSLGRIIDGLCDHLVFGSVYFGFVFYLLSQGHSYTVWLLAIGAALSHALQSASYEERRQKYHRRLNGLDRKIIAAGHVEIDGKKSIIAEAYDTVQQISVSKNSPLDNWLAQTDLDQQSRQAAVNKTIPMVKAWSLLNANNRTVMLLVFALAGLPQWFFIYEIILLNLVLAALLFAEYRTEKVFVQQQSGDESQARN